MYAFEYRKPGSLKDATALLRKTEDARAIAGGQSLLPAMRLRLARSGMLVDLGALAELRGITMVGTDVVVGAMTRHAEVAASKDVNMLLPVLAKVAAGIGDPQVRNLGTLGGSLANNDPAADYPAAALGLGATIETNKRSIPADKFFTGMYETALKPGELIVKVAFPMVKRAAYMKFRNPASGYAMVGVFVSEVAGQVRVAVTGAAGCAFRVKAMEKALAAKFAPESVARIKVPAEELNADLHATAEYRSHLITVMTQRAVEAALKGR
jgi:carbon-monoxide dehydrogenase medium subunit